MLLLEMLSKDSGGGHPSLVGGWSVGCQKQNPLNLAKAKGVLIKQTQAYLMEPKVEKGAEPYEELEPQSSHLARIKTTILYI